ncbi:MAG: hypothetical protein KBA55_00010 [Ruminococcus sp.]|nr:hypothetical protein [Ruminococcus sp.]
MKKHEKVLMSIFLVSIAAFICDFLFEVLLLGTPADYQFFGGITQFLSVFFVISAVGIMTILTTVWVRKRREAGLPPISKAYTISFILSFIPFLALVIFSASQSDFVFMGETVSHGFEAFIDYMLIAGIVIFSIIAPVFPVIIYWQLLYLIHRFRNKKYSASRK